MITKLQNLSLYMFTLSSIIIMNIYFHLYSHKPTIILYYILIYIYIYLEASKLSINYH